MEIFFERGLVVSIFLYAVTLPISMSAVNFSLALIFFFFALLCIQKKIHCFVPISLFCILSFFLWATITDWLSEEQWSIARLSSFSKVWNLLPYILISFTFRIVGNKTLPVLKTVIISSALVVLLGAIQYWTDIHYFFEGWFGSDALVIENRFYGFQSHPMHSGGLYTILFLIAFSIALFYKVYPAGLVIDRTVMISSRNERIFWNIVTIFLGVGVLLTGARSYYLAALAGAIILLSVKGWRALLTGFVVGTILLVSVAAFHPYIRERIKTINFNHMDDSTKERIVMWESALLMIRSHPVTGVGYKKWKDNISHYMSRFNEDLAAFAHAHNSYLTIASETGLVGLTIFLVFWFYLIKEQFTALRFTKRETFSYALNLGTISVLFSLMVAAFFEHNLLTAIVSLTLFFVIGLSRSKTKSEIYEVTAGTVLSRISY